MALQSDYPLRASFSGHESFPFRYMWLRKAFNAVEQNGDAFLEEDAVVKLGVGKNMVRSMRHWAQVSGIIEEAPVADAARRSRPLAGSELGHRLFGDGGWDPYLEDPATLWLLHWNIASTGERATTWYWAFNHLPQPEFTREDLARWLLTVVEEQGWRGSPASLKRDVDCFIRSYVPVAASKKSFEDSLDCPLVELELIREMGRGRYLLQRAEQASLPDEIFAYAVVDYICRAFPRSKTIPLDQVAYGFGAPGRVFALTENEVLRRLDRLLELTEGALSFDETAGLRQVLVHHLPGTALDLLDECFRVRAGEQPRAGAAS